MDHKDELGLVSRSPAQVRFMDRRLKHGTLFGTNRLPAPKSIFIPFSNDATEIWIN